MSEETTAATESTSLQAVIAEVRDELARLEPMRMKAQEAFEAIENPVYAARCLIIRADEGQLRQHLAKLKAIQ